MQWYQILSIIMLAFYIGITIAEKIVNKKRNAKIANEQSTEKEDIKVGESNGTNNDN